MRKNVRQAMNALFAGKEYTNASIQTRQIGAKCPECLTWHPTVYSYGSHFPLVILTDADVAYVNTEKYSATTSTQQSGVATYLYYEGYEPTGEYLTQKGYERFAIYRKVTSERWPSPEPYQRSTSVWSRPNHHAAKYDGPVYHAGTKTYGPRS